MKRYMDIKIKQAIDVKVIFFGLLAVLFPSLIPLPMLSPWMVLFLGLIIGMLIISFMEEEDRRFLFIIFTTSYFVRIFLAFFFHLITLNWQYVAGASRGFNGFFIGDGCGYSENGWTIANRIAKGLPVDYLTIKLIVGSRSGALHAYDYINGIVYFLIGKNPLNMFFLNSAIGALTIIFVYRLTILIFERKVAKMASILCAFWPSLILWSTQNLKEPLTIFLLVLCFWGFVSFLNRFNPMYLIIVFFSLFLLLNFRSPIAKIVIISLVLHLLFLGSRLIKRVPILIFLIIPVIFLIFMGLRDFVIRFFNPLEDDKIMISGLINQINYLRRVRAVANLAILPNYNITSVGALLLYLPVGLLAVLFGPFPWQLFSFSQIFAAPEMLVWYILSPYLIKGVYLSIKNNMRYLCSILIYVSIFLGTLAALEGNIGTMFRHRAVAMDFLLIFVAVGAVGAKKRINRNDT